jgi:hypothetical protein
MINSQNTSLGTAYVIPVVEWSFDKNLEVESSQPTSSTRRKRPEKLYEPAINSSLW